MSGEREPLIPDDAVWHEGVWMGIDKPIPDPEWMLCGVCGLVLEKFDEVTGDRVRYTWLHPYDYRKVEDHKVQPVMRKDMDPAKINERCDFCLARGPRWVLPVENFQEPFSASVSRNQDTKIISDSDWTACDDCAELIRKGYWDRLTKRAYKAFKDRNQGQVAPHAELMMRMLYREISRHVKGPLQPRGDLRT